MSRISNTVSTKKRRKKELKETKGFFGSKHKLYKTAHEQLRRSKRNSFIDRRKRKSQMRSIWISRINIACRNRGIKYSRFMRAITLSHIKLSRWVISDFAIRNNVLFDNLIEKVREYL